LSSLQKMGVSFALEAIVFLVGTTGGAAWFPSLYADRPRRVGLQLGGKFHGKARLQTRHCATPSDANIWYLDWGESSFDEVVRFGSTPPSPSLQKASVRTWNWCANFVVPHNLCPWASSSVNTQGAIRLYLTKDTTLFEKAIDAVAERFCLEMKTGTLDSNTAIAFVILAEEVEERWDFESFYDWFLEKEEQYLDAIDEDPDHVGNAVTLAPFHPAWLFAGEDENPIQLEKRSPYSTVSIVATSTIDKAGPSATAAIAQHNEEIFRSKSSKDWEEIYERALRTNADEVGGD
jgi:hypothetical protein